MKKTPVLLLSIAAALMGFATNSRAAISVTSTGTGTNSFATAPAASDWSTASFGTSAGTYEGAGGATALDVNVNTRAASAISATLGTSATAPAAAAALAQYVNDGGSSTYLQTRPTGTEYTVLMATLQNNSGAAISALNVMYTFANLGPDATETIKKHRAFFSLTGQPGCWKAIPEFTTAEPGTLSATLNLGSWANGASLYILWADDNGSNPDGIYTIDDFSATPLPAAPTEWCWSNFAGSLTADGDSDGTGSAALFSGLYGIDINGAGNMLFVADRGAGKIKSISIPGAVVTTVSAQADLTELVVDKVNGNVYFTSQGAGTINRLEAPGYTTVTPIATGLSSFALGIDSAADILYVSGISSGSIYYISNASSATPGALTLLAGNGTSAGFVNGALADARFNAPMGIAISGTGTNAILYVGDRDNDAIRKIDLATGMVTTVAGGIGRGCGPGQIAGPHGVYLGTDGNLYVPGQESYTIIKVALPSGDVTHIGGLCGTAGASEGCGSAALNGNISQLTMDSAGNIYTVDRGGINGADHARVSKGVPPAPPGTPLQITSISIPDAPPTPAQWCWTNYAGSLTGGGEFGGIYGIDINGAGNTLFVADRDGGTIKSISIPGGVVTLIRSQADLTELVVDKVNGNIYFTSQGAATISRLDAPGYTTVTEIGSGVASFALGIDSAADILYVSGINSGSIFYIPNASTTASVSPTLLAGDGATAGSANGTLAEARFNAPMGIAVSGTGTNAILYVGDRDNNAIRKVDIAGNSVTTVAGGIGRGCGPGQIAGPHGVWLGADGNLYVPGQESYTVIKVALPSGEVTHISGLCGTAGAADGCSSEARNGNISQLTMDGAGNIYTADRGGINGADQARVSKGVLAPQIPGGPGSNVQIDFTAPTAGPCSFFLQCASSVNGPYTDCGTVTQLGPNSYRAVVPISGDMQFYRIRQ